MAKGGADWQTGYRHGLQGKALQPPTSVKMIEDYNDGYSEGKKEKKDRETFKASNSSAFQNGRNKALDEIARIQNGVGDKYVTDEDIKPNHGIIATGPGYQITRKNSGVVQVIKSGKVVYEGDEAGAKKFAGHP